MLRMNVEDQLRIIAQQLAMLQKQNIQTHRFAAGLNNVDPNTVDNRFIGYNGDIREVNHKILTPSISDIKQRVIDRQLQENFDRIPLGELGIEEETVDQ
jgi:hypothetical protein